MLSALNLGLYVTVSKIADRARSENVALTEPSYTTLMQALAEMGKVDEAVGCLDLMQGMTYYLRNWVITIAIYISVLC